MMQIMTTTISHDLTMHLPHMALSQSIHKQVRAMPLRLPPTLMPPEVHTLLVQQALPYPEVSGLDWVWAALVDTCLGTGRGIVTTVDGETGAGEVVGAIMEDGEAHGAIIEDTEARGVQAVRLIVEVPEVLPLELRGLLQVMGARRGVELTKMAPELILA